jgi:hypothetical protein
LLGEWFAAVVGLGPLLPQEHVRKTLQSIYRNNFRHDFTDFANPQRIYALNDEKGLLLCSWPKGKRPPLPFVYSDEVWTGIEYQVAAHLIYEGMVDEGLAIVRACRDRYDGLRRNPWNEVECGSHYARAMSSWSLLLALSRYHYSATGKWISFAPLVNAHDFRCFFTTGGAWGVFSQKAGEKSLTTTVEVKKGTLELTELRLKPSFEPRSVTATLAGQPVEARVAIESGQALTQFGKPVRLAPSQIFRITLAG